MSPPATEAFSLRLTFRKRNDRSKLSGPPKASKRCIKKAHYSNSPNPATDWSSSFVVDRGPTFHVRSCLRRSSKEVYRMTAGQSGAESAGAHFQGLHVGGIGFKSFEIFKNKILKMFKIRIFEVLKIKHLKLFGQIWQNNLDY